ncbi:MAG TPA: hypothetical protein VEL47_00080 [Myxococcota bacterium]|nr:hypothetical protein [Myxococcota bacterium]
MIKRDPDDANGAIIKSPDGKCRFTVADYSLEMSFGNKVTISLQGYYEKDPEYPTQRTLVTIERYGFKEG